MKQYQKSAYERSHRLRNLLTTAKCNLDLILIAAESKYASENIKKLVKMTKLELQKIQKLYE